MWLVSCCERSVPVPLKSLRERPVFAKLPDVSSLSVVARVYSKDLPPRVPVFHVKHDPPIRGLALDSS